MMKLLPRPNRLQALGLAALTLLGFAASASAAGPGWQRATPFGGPLLAVAEAPSATSVLYAAAGNGRFFRSRSTGATWERRALLPPDVEDLQVAPHDFLTVYARTGSRLFRSRNGGHTWKDLGPSAVVALDPVHFGVLFAATGQGLLRSTDHGDTFEPWAFANVSVVAVAIDPHDLSTLFAVTDQSESNPSLFVWKSTDDGRTWVQTGISATRPAIDFVRPRFIFDPEHAGTLYAAFVHDARLDPIYRTTDGGSTWTSFAADLGLVDLVAAANGTLIGSSFFGTSRSRDGGTTWNPSLPAHFNSPLQPRDTLVRLAPSAVPEKVLAAGATGFWFSANAGAAWTSSNQGILAQGATSVAVAPMGPPAVYATAGIGVFRSLDEGTTWAHRYTDLFDFSPLYLETFHPEVPTTLYATGFDGVETYLAESTNGGRNWAVLPVPYNCNSGDSLCDIGMFVAGLDPHDPDAVFVAGTYFFHFAGFGDFLLRSSDGFATYATLAPLHRLGTLIVDTDRADTLYGITCTGLHRSQDGGKTWRRFGTGLPKPLCPQGTSHPVMARDPQDGRKLYVGTLTQGVFASADGGETFRAMNRGLETAAIQSLLIDPQDPSRLYVGLADRGVFQWNAGRTRWLPINQGLPLEGFAGFVALDPQNPSRLYAASPSLGVYRIDLEDATP